MTLINPQQQFKKHRKGEVTLSNNIDILTTAILETQKGEVTIEN